MRPGASAHLRNALRRAAPLAAAAMFALALFALYRLMRTSHPNLAPASEADIVRARPIVERSRWTYANLVFRRDKALLFSDAGDAFLMYCRHGRSWIAMGDPVGAEAGVRALLRRYRNLCDRHDGWCVFFEVRGERRDLYAGIGLVLTPLGEEARVDLRTFSIDTPSNKNLRHARAKLLRHGFRFEILPVEAVPAALAALADVSDAWLSQKATQEKGFSNASFDVRYGQHFPTAVVRSGDRIVAFANLWLGADREEMSVDLMRHLPDAPGGTMDFLFSELMRWGGTQGFCWFNFGMAPLAGIEASPGAPIWNHVAAFLYRHGEHFYNFGGLRHYKAKFHPVWTPLYLASPGGAALPRVLLDVTALIAGSATGILIKHRDRGGPRR